MKSKVAKDKEISGWRKKGPTCGNCKDFTSEIEQIRTTYLNWGKYKKETNKRCSRFGFPTGKSSWCKHHVFMKTIII